MSAPRAALLLSLTLSACAVGPNFKRPAAPTDAGYGAAPTQGETAAAAGVGGNAQRLREGMDIPADWWTLFRIRAAQSADRAGTEAEPGRQCRAGRAAAGE